MFILTDNLEFLWFTDDFRDGKTGSERAKGLSQLHSNAMDRVGTRLSASESEANPPSTALKSFGDFGDSSDTG